MPSQQKIFAWTRASRLPSQLYLLLPLTLGQFLAFYYGALWSQTLFLLSLLYSLCLQLFIVYANDLADYETDKLNQTATPFSGGSRVLVRNLLSVRELKLGAFLCLNITVLLGFFFAYTKQDFSVLALSLIGPLLLWMYSYPPFKLSYRGGGELLQALGLALVLPLLGFMIQGGIQIQTCFFLALALFPSHLACATSTAIPDAASDHLSNKKTFVVSLGPYRSCFLIVLLHTVSYLAVIFLLQAKLIFGASSDLLKLVVPQVLLTFLFLRSFYKRQINQFVFYSIFLVLYLMAYLIYLSISSGL